MADLTALSAQADTSVTLETQAVALIQQLSSNGDQAAIDAITSKLKTSSDNLSGVLSSVTPPPAA